MKLFCFYNIVLARSAMVRDNKLSCMTIDAINLLVYMISRLKAGSLSPILPRHWPLVGPAKIRWTKADQKGVTSNMAQRIKQKLYDYIDKSLSI